MNKSIHVWALVLLAAIVITAIVPLQMGAMEHEDEHAREHFIDIKNEIISHNMAMGDYKCCLEKPCAYCIEKSPGHGEGATCNCIGDLMDGVHPCGECIGEIMEGHGNPYLSKYFAAAIAEKVGEEHIDTLREIMFEKYDVPVEDQY